MDQILTGKILSCEIALLDTKSFIKSVSISILLKQQKKSQICGYDITYFGAKKSV